MKLAQPPVRKQTLHSYEPLFRKVRQAAGGQDALSCLKQLAVDRGDTFEPPSFLRPGMQQFSNEELGVALCLPHHGQQPNSLRIAAEVISADGVSFKRLGHLAVQERCVPEIAYIARCGQKTEPDNPFWADLLRNLPEKKARQPVEHMPHWTRFAILGGINRNGEKQIHWLRPFL